MVHMSFVYWDRRRENEMKYVFRHLFPEGALTRERGKEKVTAGKRKHIPNPLLSLLNV